MPISHFLIKNPYKLYFPKIVFFQGKKMSNIHVKEKQEKNIFSSPPPTLKLYIKTNTPTHTDQEHFNDKKELLINPLTF